MMVLGTLLLSLILVTRTCLAAECACSTLNVHIRQGPGTSHAQLGMLIPPHCLTYTGQQVTAEGYTWAKVEYQSKEGWIATKWLTFKACGSHGNGKQGIWSLVDTKHWLAVNEEKIITSGPQPADVHISSVVKSGVPAFLMDPQGVCLTPPSTSLFITQPHMGVTLNPAAPRKSGVSKTITWIANVRYGIRMCLDYSDIEYSFLIGEDGNVYEGRGWDMVGAHTLGHNHDGLGFCVIGTFTHQLPNDAAMSALKRLIGCAVTMGKVTSTYTLKGHRDVRPTECPGQKLYDVIRTWPHYG